MYGAEGALIAKKSAGEFYVLLRSGCDSVIGDSDLVIYK